MERITVRSVYVDRCENWMEVAEVFVEWHTLVSVVVNFQIQLLHVIHHHHHCCHHQHQQLEALTVTKYYPHRQSSVSM
jgi:hypothetical protein